MEDKTTSGGETVKEMEYIKDIEPIMKATNQKNYNWIKENLKLGDRHRRGYLSEMYVSKLLDGNGHHTLRTISRNDNGADILCYNDYKHIIKLYQVKNQTDKVNSSTINSDFIKVFDNEQYINKPYAYIAINGYSDIADSEGYYRITKSEILELIEETKVSKELDRQFPERSKLRDELEDIIIIKEIKDISRLKEVIEKLQEISPIRQILKKIQVSISRVLRELEPKLLDEYYIKLYDFDFIKELIDNYDPMIEQGSISEEEFNSIYKKAIEKYIYDKSKMMFHKEHELLIKAYDERSIKIEYVKALEDLQRCIYNKINIKAKKTGPSYEEKWLKKFNLILTPGKPLKDSFNSLYESDWIRDQIQSLIEGTLFENRRECLYNVNFIETFISLYYKIKR